MKRASDFFAPQSGKAARGDAAAAPRVSWRVVEEGADAYILRTDSAAQPSVKVAAFDMVWSACLFPRCVAFCLPRRR